VGGVEITGLLQAKGVGSEVQATHITYNRILTDTWKELGNASVRAVS